MPRRPAPPEHRERPPLQPPLPMPRREFMQRAAFLAGGASIGAGVLSFAGEDAARATSPRVAIVGAGLAA